MSPTSPALVSQDGVRRLARSVLLLVCVVYVLAGFVGRDAWRNDDVVAVAHMGEIAAGLADVAIVTDDNPRSEDPASIRAAILAASMIYREIGVQLRREGLDSVHHRTVVSTTRKLVLLASAWTQASWIRMAETPPETLKAIQYLAQQCQDISPSSQYAGAYFPNRAMPQRVAWVFDLLERRENERLNGRQNVRLDQRERVHS